MGLSRPVQCIGILLVILCFAPVALAQDTFTITGANPDNYSMGGVYVSPYQATIQNGGQTIYSGLVICDDFTDEVTVPETWTVDSSTVDSGGSGLFGSTSSADYNAVAWLADELLTGGTYNDQIVASELSFAIWTIFDPGAINYVTGIGALSAATVQAAVQGDIATALGEGTYTGPTVTVWTPTSWSSNVTRPQEFLTVATPEASLAATLAVSLLSFAGLVFLMRRRLVRPL
ncbi:MAG: hypothetical protein ABSB23_17680 [Bryobacteraceae bacterium]|jgi:hypothetical protein